MSGCRSCGAALVAGSTISVDSVGYCRDCGDLVYAFRPDQAEPDSWYLVSEEAPVGGEVVEGGQCEGCGLSEYLIVERVRHDFVAVCDGQTWDEEWLDGCGLEHPVRMKMACEVWSG